VQTPGVLLISSAAWAPNPQTQTYGDAAPTLIYTVNGLVNGDTLTCGLATSATLTSPVGEYAIDKGTLAAAANYALSYQSALLTVDPNAPPAAIFGDTFNSPSTEPSNPVAPAASSQDIGLYSGFTSPGYDKPFACTGGRVCAGQ
jgi:hypothetical protein